MKFLPVLLLFIGVVFPGMAEGQEFAGQESFLSGQTPVTRLERNYRYNPAAFVLLDSLQSGHVSINYRAFGGESLHSLYGGNKGYAFGAGANGYKVIPGKGIYSGALSWQKGEDRNVGWTNVRDVKKLYPYLVADSLGGDYHNERYRLEGSWAVYAGKGIYGLRARYLGEVAYRLRDPRPRNTTSELTLNPGAMWQTDRGYAGMFFKYAFYRQHLATQIAEPNRKDRFYILTGMGLYDHYYSSVKNDFSRYYRSHEYQAGVQLGQGKQGFSGRVSYSFRKMEVEESDFRKPFMLKTGGLELFLSWRKSLKNSTLLLTGGGQTERRKGTERTFEQVRPDAENSTFIWKKLTESQKYEQNTANVYLNLLLQHDGTDGLSWWYGMHGFWQREQERYLLPEYKKELTDMAANIRVGIRRQFRAGHLEAEWQGGYKNNLSSSLSAPEEQIVVKNMLLPEYEYRGQDYYTSRLRLEFGVPVYRKTILAFYSDTRCAFAGKNRYHWFTEAGIYVAF